MSVYFFFNAIKDRLLNLALHLVRFCLDPLDWFEVKDF